MKLAACALVLAASAASAEPLPPGSLSLAGGMFSGTGADADPLGFGTRIGGMAAWQPISTERRWGWAVRWSTLFGHEWDASAAKVSPNLLTVDMDLTIGLRFRPWSTPSRYLTARAGGMLLRSNEPIPPKEQRAFLGGVASVGLDQYIGGIAMINVDVRYGLLGGGPEGVALIVGIGVVGP